MTIQGILFLPGEELLLWFLNWRSAASDRTV